MRIKNARHHDATFGIDHSLGIKVIAMARNAGDLAASYGNRTPAVQMFIDKPGIPDNQIVFHKRAPTSLIMRSAMPFHWLRPTVIGARRPSARPQRQLMPISLA